MTAFEKLLLICVGMIIGILVLISMQLVISTVSVKTIESYLLNSEITTEIYE